MKSLKKETRLPVKGREKEFEKGGAEILSRWRGYERLWRGQPFTPQ